VSALIIRPEKPSDYRETEFLTRDAFWDVYRPGCNEHLLVHKLRDSPAFIAELDLVACNGDIIVGNIMYSKARVLPQEGIAHEVLCIGPVSVHPECQNQGVGSKLMRESLARARELGFCGVFLMGNPAYYARFGFIRTDAYGIFASDGKSYDHFMGLELRPGSLSGISGIFLEDEVFNIAAEELEEFEKQFPSREKHVTPTQLWSS
jgi:predicted N-acetyltransferase YhbS